MGEWAPDYLLMGWGEGTISARLWLTHSNMTIVSPAHPEFRKFLVDQFVERVKDGGQGFQLDKAGITSLLDFNPNLPTSPDRSLPQGVLLAYADITAKTREVDPEVAIASEMFWDRAFPFVDVSYARMNEIDMPSPALKYTFPEWTSTICAESSRRLQCDEQRHALRIGVGRAASPL